jgi:hypothetical protein
LIEKEAGIGKCFASPFIGGWLADLVAMDNVPGLVKCQE